MRKQSDVTPPMLCQYIFSLLFSICCSQSIIRIGIIDDHEHFKGIIPINLPNLTFCGQKGVHLQLEWINRSRSFAKFIHELELEENTKHVYWISTDSLTTKFMTDFCQINQIPLVNFNENNPKLCSLTTAFQRDYFLLPNLLQILVNYFKSNHIRNAVYVYKNIQSTDRIYQLLGLMNEDEYFHSFALDIRIIEDENIYSLLYSIEWHSREKNHLSKYVILDLDSYEDYQRIFEKISHMGLTSDSYQYIILSTIDACLWINNLTFTGRLIYFDDQERNCTVDHLKINENSLRRKSRPTFYRSSLSFRNHPFAITSFNSHDFSLLTRPISLNNTNVTINACYTKMKINEEYFPFSTFHLYFPTNFSRLYLQSLFKSLNLIIRIVRSNLLNCKTYRLKSPRINRNQCQFSDINIYSRRGSSTRQYPQSIELMGRYSTMTNQYQSCEEKKSKDFLTEQRTFSSQAYYITTLFDEPFVMLRKGSRLHAKYDHPRADLNELRGEILDFHQLEGFCVDLAEQICTILNITCRFRIVEDGNFGSKNHTTGIWNGMVGEVVTGKADMAIGPLTISQERMEVVDFSKPFMILGISIVIRKPDKQKPGVFSFMNPVSMEIWLCLSLAYVAVSAVLFLTSRVVNAGWRRRVVRRPSYRSFSYPKSVNDRRKSEIQLLRFNRESNHSSQSTDITNALRASLRRRHHQRTRSGPMNAIDPKSGKKKKDMENSVHAFGISNALFFSFSSFMRQSINLVPKSLSGRVAATSWWYFSLIFVSSYTANLVAFLTVEKLVTPIESVEDLAKQQEIKYGLIKNGTTAAFFEKSNVTLFQNMWSVMQQSSSELLVATNDEGVAKVRHSKGKYAVFIESTKSEYVNERLPCDTMKVGSDLDSKGYGIATRLGSSLTEAINIIITNLRESGFVDKLKQRWWYDRSQCSSTSNDKSFSELSLSSVTGLFYIFLFGVIVSCIIGFTEFLINAKNEAETLQINFREILRIKMIENMIGMTIHIQRQLESVSVDEESNPHNDNDEDEIIRQYTEYQLLKPQTDV